MSIPVSQLAPVSLRWCKLHILFFHQPNETEGLDPAARGGTAPPTESANTEPLDTRCCETAFQSN